MKTPVYLDHHATTPVDPRVLDAMLPFFREHFGNAASHTHVYGWRAEAAVEEARERVAEAIGAASAAEIVFTSGATEANNLALAGAVAARSPRRPGVVTLATEHRAVLDPCRALEAAGASLTVLPVDEEGLADPDAVASAVDARTAVVSVMAANNEIGVVQPVAQIATRCRERGAWVHCDAAQAVGTLPMDVESAGIDLLSLSGHKLYGPKGIGALYVRARRPHVTLVPQIRGGGHERGLRSGTLPVPLCVGLGHAVALAARERDAEARRLTALRERLLAGLRETLSGVRLNGHATRRLPGNLNVSFDGVEADALLARLRDLALSTGSACSSASPEPSHVLAALGHPPERVRGALRLGLGRGTTREEVDFAVRRLVEGVRAERERAPAEARARLRPGG